MVSDIPSFREIISDGLDGILFKSTYAAALYKSVIKFGTQDPFLKKRIIVQFSRKSGK